jgi:hypothetical protein
MLGFLKRRRIGHLSTKELTPRATDAVEVQGAAASGVLWGWGGGGDVMCGTLHVTEPLWKQHMVYELKVTLAGCAFQSARFLFSCSEENACKKRPHANELWAPSRLAPRTPAPKQILYIPPKADSSAPFLWQQQLRHPLRTTVLYPPRSTAVISGQEQNELRL